MKLLETLIKPVKWLDESVLLRQYTKLGQRMNIQEGDNKALIAGTLWIFGYLPTMLVNAFTGGVTQRVLNATSFVTLGANDGLYNGELARGEIKDEEVSDSTSQIIDPQRYFHSKYNSYVRLPTFLIGLGLVGKFGFDVINSIKNKTPMGSESYHYLIAGLGHLSLASSMYLKETNPKLLDKAPFWKRLYESLKEKISSLVPSPIPAPSPSYSLAENQ